MAPDETTRHQEMDRSVELFDEALDTAQRCRAEHFQSNPGETDRRAIDVGNG